MIEPHERLVLLRELHLPALGELESRVLAARVLGWRSPEIARRLHRDERDIRRVIERIEMHVCIAAGIRRDAAILAFWFGQHVECRLRCTAVANRMIENGAVFPPENTPGKGLAKPRGAGAGSQGRRAAER